MVEVDVASLDPQVATDGTSFEVIADYTDGLMQMERTAKPLKPSARKKPSPRRTDYPLASRRRLLVQRRPCHRRRLCLWLAACCRSRNRLRVCLHDERHRPNQKRR
jgi:hypothetical protein